MPPTRYPRPGKDRAGKDRMREFRGRLHEGPEEGEGVLHTEGRAEGPRREAEVGLPRARGDEGWRRREPGRVAAGSKVGTDVRDDRETDRYRDGDRLPEREPRADRRGPAPERRRGRCHEGGRRGGLRADQGPRRERVLRDTDL